MATYNFSAGPAMLPAEVMKIAQEEFCNYDNSGSGIMELSHRGKQFAPVIEQAEANIRKLMNISDDYAVCFIQGGASMQFAMVPMNLMLPGQGADYADTGTWSAKAAKEAKRFGEVNICASSKATNYDRIPVIRHWKMSEKPSYIHITSNNKFIIARVDIKSVCNLFKELNIWYSIFDTGRVIDSNEENFRFP